MFLFESSWVTDLREVFGMAVDAFAPEMTPNSDGDRNKKASALVLGRVGPWMEVCSWQQGARERRSPAWACSCRRVVSRSLCIAQTVRFFFWGGKAGRTTR